MQGEACPRFELNQNVIRQWLCQDDRCGPKAAIIPTGLLQPGEPAYSKSVSAAIAQGDAPYLLDTSYSLTADITVPEGGAEGMIATSLLTHRAPPSGFGVKR
jgi:hypothetical protein